jgi:EAL domain-containing protein (putative c-di-GMP-specific phosphodiesterase class I)
MAFHRQPFRIHTANSAKEALGILERTSVDVVVSDERMPVMTGSQFLSILRRDYPDTIRIILSGQADLSAILSAINDAQAHHFLLKPCAPNEIASCVARAIDEREQKQRSASERGRRTEIDRLQALADFEAACGTLWVAFQPVVRALDAGIFAYEALIRSDHPNLNTPVRLFAAAAACQCVEQLERSIRERIGQEAHRVPGDARLMVNIAPCSLCDEELYSETSPLYPHRERIVFEITERERLHEVPGAEAALNRIRALGYHVAIDDLGAGYAGLNSFALMRPDVAKFDMELIRDIHLSDTKSNLVRTIALLCKEMGILTVAEGIETIEEYAAASALGCDLLQGYYISRPARSFAHAAELFPGMEVPA